MHEFPSMAFAFSLPLPHLYPFCTFHSVTGGGGSGQAGAGQAFLKACCLPRPFLSIPMNLSMPPYLNDCGWGEEENHACHHLLRGKKTK